MTADQPQGAPRESGAPTRVIRAEQHRVLDFITVVAFAAAPSVLGLSGVPALASYALAAVHLLLTLLTRFSPGGGQPLALKLHGLVEMVVGPVLFVAPFALGWTGVAKTFYLAAGVVIFAVWALSAYDGDGART